ncbi:hypothetical protein D9611_013530 [Ephemerocybe angulata]|uniref:F-box domain-containing protein n=1 Tax=Ephemerocybe angulata TaxID=980116 RepID=A0A8H5C5K2_9AGAR|nr:hypothetical protein D9611_013530 [Tulosesus angulatus]
MLSSSCLSDVPEEIWLQIFKAYLDTAHAAALAPNLDRKTMMPLHHAFLHSNPFVLSAVCKDWRSICLDNSTLWSTLYLCFSTHYDDPLMRRRGEGRRQLLKKVIDGMELWLARTKNQPLFISFNMHLSTHHPPCPLIKGSAQQIQTLDIRLPPRWYNAFDKLEFPLLTTLKVQVPGVKVISGYRTRGADIAAPLDLSQCPRLSSVEVTGIFSHNQIVLPWHQIVKIQLSEVVPRDLVEVLTLLPNIEECLMDFGDSSDYMGHDFPTERVRARNLKSLTLKNVGYKAGSILRIIPLHLCHLGVLLRHIGFDGAGYEERDGIFDHIPPFSDTLLSLSINLCPSTSRGRAKYIVFLSQFRSLVTLELLNTEKMLYNDFIEALLMVPGRLPNLRSVTINWQSASNVYDDVLLAALRFRRNVDAGLNVGSEEPPAPHAGAVLERFELQCWSAEGSEPPGASIKPELMQLVRDGLKLEIFDRRTGLYTP